MGFPFCKIENLTNDKLELYIKEFEPNEIYIIPDDERNGWSNNDDVIKAIIDGKISIHNEAGRIETLSKSIDYLKGFIVNTQCIDKFIKIHSYDGYTAQPYGAAKSDIILCSNVSCEIELSNPSEDGLTFTYSCSKTPKKMNYIFQNNFSKRSWITNIDEENHRLTVSSPFSYPQLEAGLYSIYAEGTPIIVEIPEWTPTSYLWGIMCRMFWYKTIDGNDVELGIFKGRNDLIEFSIADLNNLFQNEQYVNNIFGCSVEELEPILISKGFEWSTEFVDSGCWVKYYDESFVPNITGKIITSSDGSPGQLFFGLFAVATAFMSNIDDTKAEYFIDLMPTQKDDEKF